MADKHISLPQLQSVISAFAAKNDERFLKNADITNYTIKKESTATQGYLSTYKLYAVDQEGVETVVSGAAAINIPKDFLVKSATLETATAQNAATVGVAEGDKYIDFVINTRGNEEAGQDEHIYLAVNDLVDVYTAGDGLDLTNGEFSVVIDSNNARGLSVGANGVALALATASTSGVGGSAGALSAADKEKLDNITMATSEEIEDLIDSIYAEEEEQQGGGGE